MDWVIEICVWIFILLNSYYIYDLAFNNKPSGSLTTACYLIGNFFGGLAFGRILGIIVVAYNKNIPFAPYGSYIIGLLMVLYLSSFAVTLSSDMKNFLTTMVLRVIVGTGILSFGIFNSWVTKIPWFSLIFIAGIIVFIVLAIINYIKFNNLQKIVPRDNETNKKRRERESAQGAALGMTINSLCFGVMFLTFLLGAGFLP